MASDDILDEQNNPIARQFDDMITQASQQRRQQLVSQLNSVAAPRPIAATAASAAQWFMPTVDVNPLTTKQVAASAPAVPAAPVNKADEATLTAQLRAKSSAKSTAYGNLRTIRPGASRSAAKPTKNVATPAPSAVTPPTNPAIMALANNDDLNVATLAREAQKAKQQTEVVISLH
jgi:hypothetical protein